MIPTRAIAPQKMSLSVLFPPPSVRPDTIEWSIVMLAKTDGKPSKAGT